MAKYIGTMSDGRIINLKSVDDKIVRIVQNDKDTTVINFEITKDAGFDNISLANINVHINYNNVNADTNENVTDVYDAQDWEGDSYIVKFSWRLGSNASVYAGKCYFQIVITATDENDVIIRQWSSTICSIEVVRSLEDVNITQPKSFIDYITQVKKSVSDGKSKVASAITEKGVATEATDTFATMAENIRNIPSGNICGLYVLRAPWSNPYGVIGNIYGVLPLSETQEVSQ